MTHTLPQQDVTVLLDTAQLNIEQLDAGQSGTLGSGAPRPPAGGVRLVSVEEKERLIRSGVSYGELLTPEAPPSEVQRWAFTQSLERSGPRVAELLVALAGELYQAYGPQAVLVSLARAGTPVGCALRRLARRWGLDWPHYTVSIIRGAGLDQAALAQIELAHPGRPLVFVDGWTGKGSIHAALSSSLPEECPPRLAVLSDPAGVAMHSATFDDLLLPHAALNATVCGLLSRTFLPPGTDSGAAAAGRHRALIEENLRPHDQTALYLDALDELVGELVDELGTGRAGPPTSMPHAAQRGERPTEPFAAVWALARAQGVSDPHLVKPSVGEATRVFLRRQPAGLWVRDRRSPEVEHLLALADAASVPVTEVPDLTYQAAALIAPGGGTE